MDDEPRSGETESGHEPSEPNEPGSRGSFLSPSALVGLRRVLNALRDGWFLESRIGHVAEIIAADARAAGLRAEQMLIGLKRVWPSLVEYGRAPSEAQLHMLAERLATLCIVAYYAGRVK